MNLFRLLNHLSPLQDPPAPAKQIPIYVSPLLLTLLVLNTGLAEYGCTFTVIANMDSMSGIISPDGLKSPIMSDELHFNGVSMLIRIDNLLLSIDIIN